MTSPSALIAKLAPYRLVLILAALAALSLACLYIGYRLGKNSLKEAVIEQQRDLIKTQGKRGDITAESTVVYVDRIVTVREEAQVIVQEVMKYVPNDCVLPDSVRVFHDAAARGAFPGTAGTDDAAGETAQDAAG